MFSAKGTTQTKTTAAPRTPDKGRTDAASKSVAALTSRKRPAKRDNSKLVYAAAAVFAILVIVMLGAVLKKKPGSAASSARSAAAAVTRKAKKAAGDVAEVTTGRKQRAATPSPGAAAAPVARHTPRSAGLRSREPVASRRERVRTARVPREKPVRSRDKTSRRSTGADEVTAIGEGTALIGKRTVRVGDVIRGRVVREIGADFVKVEYGGTVFSVRIGEALP
jgi:hypothetical protein